MIKPSKACYVFAGLITLFLVYVFGYWHGGLTQEVNWQKHLVLRKLAYYSVDGDARVSFCLLTGPFHTVVKVDVDNDSEINVKVGDVIQFASYNIPVVPAFLKAKMYVETSSDSLQHIGKTEKGMGEGSFREDTFFLARNPGKTEVTITLTDENGKPFEGHQRKYKVSVKND